MMDNAIVCHYEYMWTMDYGQDGVMYKDFLFRFDGAGCCKVYSISQKKQISSFMVDRVLIPHSNAVCFGTEFYEPTDEFPLLYSNIYNNYAKSPDRLEGTCCVYRLKREANQFEAKLVQVIRIDFVENTNYWKSGDGIKDTRPYGNFVINTDSNKLYAFTMRDCDHVTRYFEFDLPKVADGEYSSLYDVNVVRLTVSDIKSFFDCEYSNYLQGACYYDNKIYSLEGFSGTAKPAKLQIIDLVNQKQLTSINLYGIGLIIEPEFVDVYDGVLYYSDAEGRLFSFGKICELQKAYEE